MNTLSPSTYLDCRAALGREELTRWREAERRGDVKYDPASKQVVLSPDVDVPMLRALAHAAVAASHRAPDRPEHPNRLWASLRAWLRVRLFVEKGVLRLQWGELPPRQNPSPPNGRASSPPPPKRPS